VKLKSFPQSMQMLQIMYNMSCCHFDKIKWHAKFQKD